MNLYEHESKNILVDAGVPIPPGSLVNTVDEVLKAGKELGGGPVALKAQVLATGRGKAGGIRFAETPSEAKQVAEEMFGVDILGQPIEKLLVERKIEINQELYVAATYDEGAKSPILIASSAGGVDVNQSVEGDLDLVERYLINPFYGLQPYQAYTLADALRLPATLLHSAQKVFLTLWDVFTAYDATLVEINPLVISKAGEVIAVDAHIDIEEDALYRQKKRLHKHGIEPREDKTRPPTAFELEARKIDEGDYRGVAGRVIDFGGNLGLLIGAGGGSLTAFDAVRRHGGDPANYCEVGGNPTVSKIYRLAKLILSKPEVEGLAVITNVFSNSRVDFLARGVVKAIVELGIDPRTYPILFRSAGAFEEDGYAILQKYGIKYVDRDISMDQAAKAAVDMMKERGL
jgi:succinyl-CoA synthetase beta subunit/citryl-CoA synthetase large subunit